MVLGNVSAQPARPEAGVAHLWISKKYLSYADSNIIVSQLLEDTLPSPVQFFSEYLQYDKNVVEFVNVTNGSNTPAPNWTITKSVTTPGIVSVTGVSSGAGLWAPGEILRFLFHVLDTATLFATTAFSDTGAMLGSPLGVTVTSDTGLLRVIDPCTPILVPDGAPLILSVQGLPNPASNRVIITYDLPYGERNIQLDLYSPTGNLVRTVPETNEPAGRDEIMLNISDLPSGMYYYELRAGNSKAFRMLCVAH